jgi:hypothetical protein
MSIEGTVQVGRTQVTSGSLLRRALRLDAVVTGASAVAYAGGAALLSDWFGVPALFLVAIGAFLAAYAVGVARLAVAVQAVGVLGFAALQYFGLRRG